MSAQDIINLLVDENGNIPMQVATDKMLQLLAGRDTYSVSDATALALDTLALEQLVITSIADTQSALVDVMKLLDTFVKGGQMSEIPDYDHVAETEKMIQTLNLTRMMMLYDALEGSADDEPTSDGDDSGADDPVEEGRSGEDDAEADTDGQDG